MKRIFALMSVMLLLWSISSYAQTSAETTVRNILERQSTDWNKGNLEGFMNGYWQSDSLMFIGKSGVTYGWQNTLNNYKKGYPDVASMGKLQFTILKVKSLSAQYQQVIGKWHLTRSKGNLEGHFTLLFQKINNQWVIVMDHSS